MITNQKIAILNPTEYKEKFHQAIILIEQDQFQSALNLLLELKQKRWTKFELYYKIAQLYFDLNQLENGLNTLKQTTPLDSEQKQKIKALNQYYQILKTNLKAQQIIEDFNEDLFTETQELSLIQQSISNYYYLINDRSQIQTLSNFECYLLFSISMSLGLCQLENLLLSKIISKLPKDVVLTFMFFSEQYQIGLEQVENDSQYVVYKALFLKMQKKYKEALQLYEQIERISPDFQIKQNILQLKSLIGENGYQYNLNLKEFSTKDVLFQMKYNYLLTKNDQIKMCANIKQMAKSQTLLEQHYRLFFLEYSLDKKNIILQKICDYLIKYSPKCAFGYACQYMIFQDKEETDKILQLIEPLQECDDSTLKYITIAKILKHKKDYTQAHITLEKARQINKYEEEIYIIKRSVYIEQKNYHQAHQTLRFLVQLENQNFIFVSQLISPIINKYEYYRVIDLLDFADQESDQFEEIRILMRILSQEAIYNEQNLISDLNCLKSNNQFTYFGHYQLSKGDLNQALQFYDLSIENQNYDEKLLCIPRIKQGIQKLKTFHQRLNQQQINDIICQMSVYNYKPVQDQIDFYKRYVDTIGFVLISLLYYDNYDQICQFINSKYDIEVPYINGFKNILITTISRIYCYQLMQIDQYSKLINSSLEYIKKLFDSDELGIEQINQFCSENKKQISQSIIENDCSIGQYDTEIRKLYQIPYFYDPISKYALIKIIKIIGYFTVIGQTKSYKDIKQWLSFYLIEQDIEKYFNNI